MKARLKNPGILQTIRLALAPEFAKIKTQLALWVRHDYTYYTAAVLLFVALLKSYFRETNKELEIKHFITQAWSKLQPTSKGPPAPTKPKSVGVTLHKLTRSRSKEVLSSLLKRSNSQTSLCSDCVTRARSHNSLAQLSVDIVDYENRHSPLSQQAAATAAPAMQHELVCDGTNCVVCQSEQKSWLWYLKTSVYISGATLSTYVVYLRFIASRQTAFNHFAAIVRGIGYLFRYKVKGDHVIPRTGPAIVTVYHGYIPLDMYFFQEYALRNIRKDAMVMVADFVFEIPLLGYIIDVGGGVRANPKVALEHLKRGGLLIVAPGGVREAMTPSKKDYSLYWGSRIGFARLAYESSAVVVPMFTQNIREVFLVLGGDNFIVKWLYNKTKLPFTAFFGPFLVPLTSVFGAALGPFAKHNTTEMALTTVKAISQKSQEALQLLMMTNVPVSK